jgi:hypothetical protein
MSELTHRWRFMLPIAPPGARAAVARIPRGAAVGDSLFDDLTLVNVSINLGTVRAVGVIFLPRVRAEQNVVVPKRDIRD